MPRSRKGAARRQAKNRWMRAARGNRGARRNLWRKVKETVIRAGRNATRDRNLIKRDYRRLWICRLSAACKQRGINYSRFIMGLKASSIDLNRKMLSEIAIADPAGFDRIVEVAKVANEPARAA